VPFNGVKGHKVFHTFVCVKKKTTSGCEGKCSGD